MKHEDANREAVITYYTGFGEREWNRLDWESLEFTVNLHYMKQYLPPAGSVLDNGAGPGKYAMHFAALGYELTLTDLTPSLVALAQGKAEERGLTARFSGGFHVRDACDLFSFETERFDAAFMMGPLYHLQEEQSRIQAVRELHRVVKPGGIVCVAFRSRANQLMNALRMPEHWKPLNNIERLEGFMADGRFDHEDAGRYTGAYFYPLAEIEPFMTTNGFETLELIGSTNLGAVLRPEEWQYWESKGEASYKKLIDLLIRQARDPSLLGMSSHLLYIGRRV
ncbi:class I SAM-dependent methyltransferase [Paenibacillus sp. R14(2021)]|uniref:class I SAM-dependent methyltransferase n=1 Tax=Paenibacillus sp. R14(2021) TaxID=2859228 RepID=UPI001C611D2D|nr:class I SAM-dependent methyltransferase [Paenibacillus sp. R14(2021)]